MQQIDTLDSYGIVVFDDDAYLLPPITECSATGVSRYVQTQMRYPPQHFENPSLSPNKVADAFRP